ncbi:DNA adenine methylase [Mucilaginibacter sp. UYP25]|uniref:DNA adenine methylase n=1 Tax=unclassified Mucilaginibacter TaxID=2617802 RepID=UPI003399EEA5
MLNLDQKEVNKSNLDNLPFEPLKPFIRWAGGKQNLVKILSENLPTKGFNRYYEPFVGAGSLFFHNNFQSSVISDINPHLINAYECIKNSPEEVFERLVYYKKHISKDYYYTLRSKFNCERETFTYEQAAIFIFLVHSSFNGIFRVNKKGEYNVPFGKINPALPNLEHLKKTQSRLIGCEMINCMYEDIIDKIKANDFIYFDPPYPPLNDTSFFQHYTIDKFSATKQYELAEYANLLSGKGVNVMISNANINSIQTLYKNWNIEKISTYRYVNCKSERKIVEELIIKNY